jgi:hypothetical protein
LKRAMTVVHRNTQQRKRAKFIFSSFVDDDYLNFTIFQWIFGHYNRGGMRRLIRLVRLVPLLCNSRVSMFVVDWRCFVATN